MIQELYLKKSLNIKKDYLKVVNDIERYENIAKDLSLSIENRTKELELLLSNLNAGSISNAEVAKQELHNIMVQTEDDMNKVELSIDSLNIRIEKLKEDELSLYKEIKQTYFQLTDDEIRKEINEYIKLQNLS